MPGHAHVLRAEGPQEVFEVEAATLQLFFSHGLEVLFREDGQGLAAGIGLRRRRLATFRQNVARFRLYRLRFLQENMRFALQNAYFKIYQII